jgi:putative flippase GtrA
MTAASDTFLLSTLTRLSGLLPGAARRQATPDRLAVLAEFLMFAVVGSIGVIVDTAVVYALRRPLGLIAAGFASYAVSATVGWLLNRYWTFRGRGGGPAHRQWALFLLANLSGFVLNRGVYVLLVTFVPLCAEQPVFATSAGAIAGMFSNFFLSRRLVFRNESVKGLH